MRLRSSGQLIVLVTAAVLVLGTSYRNEAKRSFGVVGGRPTGIVATTASQLRLGAEPVASCGCSADAKRTTVKITVGLRNDGLMPATLQPQRSRLWVDGKSHRVPHQTLGGKGIEKGVLQPGQVGRLTLINSQLPKGLFRSAEQVEAEVHWDRGELRLVFARIRKTKSTSKSR